MMSEGRRGSVFSLPSFCNQETFPLWINEPLSVLIQAGGGKKSHSNMVVLPPVLTHQAVHPSVFWPTTVSPLCSMKPVFHFSSLPCSTPPSSLPSLSFLSLLHLLLDSPQHLLYSTTSAIQTHSCILGCLSSLLISKIPSPLVPLVLTFLPQSQHSSLSY